MKIKILIAPDSFRGSLCSSEVAGYLSKGIHKVFPDARIVTIPLADGGEGTVDSIVSATKGRYINVKVHDPLMRPIHSRFGITGDGKTAVIEMAAASGVELLAPAEKSPWHTSSYGTGDLMKAALDHGCERILIGIGGSATNDGGTGMACSLGVRFLDKNGEILPGEGGRLDEIEHIDMSGLDPRIYRTEILVACDVTNPLTGPDGAAYVFGPQKGATADMVTKLDNNLKYLANLIKKRLFKDVEKIPGAGAAGGLGAGLVAFLDANLVKGFEIISGIIELEKNIAEAELIITGEGKIDFQTQFGKTAFGLAQLAKKHNKPVIAVAGTIDEKADILHGMGIDAMISIIDKPMSLNDAFEQTPAMLERAGERLARLLRLGKAL
jgi:glycerate 2-kinase